MRFGVLDLVGLGVALAFAVPMAGFGLSLLAAGRPLGAVFLAAAATLLLVEQALTTPTDLPARILAWLGGRVVVDPEETPDEKR